jgi:hypothetical protein
MKASTLLNAGLLTLLVCLAPPAAQAQIDLALIDPTAPPGKWPPTVSIVNPVDNSVFLTPANITLVLDDDSPAPVLTLTAVDPFASEKLPVMSSIDPAVFQVTRTGDLGYPLEVSYAISGTASNGLDYRALSGRLSLPAGTNHAQIVVDPLYDTLAEGSETVTLELLPLPPGSPRFYTLGEPHAAKASITDFDAETNLPTTVNVFATDPDAEESGFRELSYSGRFTFTRTGRRDIDLPVYFTLGGTAINGVDYKFVTSRVVIAAGSAETNIIILPRTDNLLENTETVILTLEPVACIDIYPPPPECYRIGPSDQATVYIKDYRTTNLPPSITLTTPANGAVFRAPATIQIEALTRDPDGYAYRAEFYADDRTIGKAAVYYYVAPLPGTPCVFPLTWTNVPAGTYILTARAFDNQGASAVSAPVKITVLDDSIHTNLPPKIVITSPTNGAVFQAPATIELEALTRDPDGYANAAQFYANDHLIGEGRIIFIRAPDPGDEIRIPFAWTNVPAGIYSLTARASDSGGAAAVSDPVKITVLEAGPKPVVTITATDCVAKERAGSLNPAKFRVHRAGPTNESLTVFYSISGAAENGKDYERLPGSVTIPPGARKAIITVNPVDDAIAEFPETVVLGLKPAPEGQPAYELGLPRLAAAVILDNDVLATTVLSGRLVHVIVPAPGPGAFRLEASANLVDWVVVQPNAAVENGAVNFVDPEAPSQPCRFYRVVPVEASAVALESLADDE